MNIRVRKGLVLTDHPVYPTMTPVTKKDPPEIPIGYFQQKVNFKLELSYPRWFANLMGVIGLSALIYFTCY